MSLRQEKLDIIISLASVNCIEFLISQFNAVMALFYFGAVIAPLSHNSLGCSDTVCSFNLGMFAREARALS